MEKLSKFMTGYKTYAGIIITIVGMTGLAKYITEGETTQLLNSIFEIIGIALAIYGRAVTNK